MVAIEPTMVSVSPFIRFANLDHDLSVTDSEGPVRLSALPIGSALSVACVFEIDT